MSVFLLIAIAVAPSAAFLYYIYNRDRYEKEPRRMLIKAFLLGIVIVVPAVIIELILTGIFGEGKGLVPALIEGFIVAGFTEELLKYFALYRGFFKAKEFNERFDGIVYSVFVSLGFATLENIFYVTSGGVSVGLTRAITAVPAHALFGVAMGYYFGRARFATPKRGKTLLLKAIFIPILLHGFYDFILFSENIILLIGFIPYMIYMWRRGLKNMNELDEAKDVLLGINYRAHQFNEALPDGQTIEEHMAYEYHPNGMEANIYPEDIDFSEIRNIENEDQENSGI